MGANTIDSNILLFPYGVKPLLRGMIYDQSDLLTKTAFRRRIRRATHTRRRATPAKRRNLIYLFGIPPIRD